MLLLLLLMLLDVVGGCEAKQCVINSAYFMETSANQTEETRRPVDDTYLVSDVIYVFEKNIIITDGGRVMWLLLFLDVVVNLLVTDLSDEVRRFLVHRSKGSNDSLSNFSETAFGRPWS